MIQFILRDGIRWHKDLFKKTSGDANNRLSLSIRRSGLSRRASWHMPSPPLQAVAQAQLKG
jgi:hypothetical protein